MNHIKNNLSNYLIFFLAVIILLCFGTDTNSKKHESIDNLYYSVDNTHTEAEDTYLLNINTQKIHKSNCGTATLILPKNLKKYRGDIGDILNEGYTKCGNCFR